jgi:hypothetical protein
MFPGHEISLAMRGLVAALVAVALIRDGTFLSTMNFDHWKKALFRLGLVGAKDTITEGSTD